MKTFLAALLLLGFPALPPAVATHDDRTSCTSENPGQACWVACHAGERISISASRADGGPVYAYLYCGDAFVACDGAARCSAVSDEEARYDAVGSCTPYYAGMVVTCSGNPDLVPAVESGPLSTPGYGGCPAYTPGVGKTCTPSGIVCVGPVDPILIVNIPVIPSIPLLPGWGVDVDLYDRSSQPRIEQGTVGPFPVTGPPVPITICDTPCPILMPTAGGLPYLSVEVTVGSESRTLTILP